MRNRWQIWTAVVACGVLGAGLAGAQDGQYGGPSYDQGQYNQNNPGPADEPGRSVARLSLLNGDVSIRRGDTNEAAAASVNAPLMVQDYVTTAPGSRAEVEFDYSNRVRLGPASELRIATLEQNRYQVQLARGFVTYSVLRDGPAQAEISTPSVSLRPNRRGEYRVFVSENGETFITVRSGEAEVYTPGGAERLRAGQSVRVRGGQGDAEYQVVSAGPRDEWDAWSERRDRDLERTVSYRYVSADITGAEDLDSYGRWSYDAAYGSVWVPSGVPVGWAPYRDGRWVWEEYYGWTWVSYEPWGWAPYHYGNWYYGSLGWAWYPGSIYGRHWYRPALVGFFGFGGGGGLSFGFGFGNVGWCPLAPYEVFHPWYGRGYYGGYGGTTIVNNINIIRNTNITNVYRNARYGASYVNSEGFANGAARYDRATPALLQNAGLVRGAVPITPSQSSLRFADRQTQAIPRSPMNNSQFYTRSTPQQVQRVPFAQQQQMAARQFGGQGLAGQTFGQGARTAAPPAQNSGAYRVPGGMPAQAGQTYGQAGRAGLPTVQPPAQNSGVYRGNSNGAGWSRFGTPGGMPPQGGSGQTYGQMGRAGAPAVQQPSQNSGAYRGGSSGDGWSRFGTPGGTPPQGSMRQQPAGGGASAGWSRFGRPSAGAPAVQQSPARPQYGPSNGPSGGWRNYESQPQMTRPNTGNPGSYRQSPYSGSSSPYPGGGYTRRSYDGGYSGRSVQVAPPVVQQRPNAGGGYYGGYNGGGRPSYSNQSRPSYGGNYGGNYGGGRPSYPSQSRPSGGEGWHAPSGGGQQRSAPSSGSHSSGRGGYQR